MEPVTEVELLGRMRWIETEGGQDEVQYRAEPLTPPQVNAAGERATVVVVAVAEWEAQRE